MNDIYIYIFVLINVDNKLNQANVNHLFFFALRWESIVIFIKTTDGT